METYRLSSKLKNADREIVIQTSNDASVRTILSTVYVDGQIANVSRTRHPGEWTPEEVLSMVKSRHGQKKEELESMLLAFNEVMDRGEPEAMHRLGTAFFFKRLFDEALALFDAAITLNNSFDGAYFYMARTEIELERYDQAVRAARAAVEMKPTYADYRHTLGECLMLTGAYKEAVAEFEEAVRINTYYGDAYFCLGLALLLNSIHQKDITLFGSVVSRSSDYFKRAGVIDDQYEGEIFAEGFKLLEEQDLEAAYVLFRKVYDNRKRDRFNDLSGFYMKYVHFYGEPSPESLDRRTEYLQEELRLHPDYVDIHTELARLYLERSRHACSLSMEHYRQALNINPSMGIVEKQLAAAQEGYSALDNLLTQVMKESVNGSK
ncbi:MAG: tetratricopeptide repeat protein [bacterium]|nr:tetratricopeptide repeat protein [bacterium]